MLSLRMLSTLPPIDLASEWTAAIVMVGVVALVITVSNWLLLRGKRRSSSAGRIARQLAFFAVCCFGAVTIVLALPLEDNLRGQMLSLAGLVFTAVVGLGSTTLFSNAMAGFMLRSMHGFRAGDFIEVEGELGRVTERGLFHTEIQIESSDLMTLPNLYLATRPVQVIRGSGTQVAGDVSLGYDVSHVRVAELLVQAAERAGLDEPFVRVMELGDFSISYRVSGRFEEVKHLLSARSKLHTAMLDSLHEGGVEIVSPTFMNQRALDPSGAVVPEQQRSRSQPLSSTEESGEAEAIIFDKAEQAERLEELAESRTKLEEAAKEADVAAGKASGVEVDDLKRQAADLRARVAAIDEELQAEADREDDSEE
jgi:small conductance mechanosensitive channel